MNNAMKRFIVLIVCSLLYYSCDKDQSQFDNDDPSFLEKNSLSEGFYMGYFVLRDQDYWCEIQFISNQYEEWPSGGALYQKEMSCLTTGTYNIDNTILSFDLNSYKYPTYPSPCDPKMTLPGEYKIHLITVDDSLIFSKGVGENKIKYYLNKVTK